ncbi:MAG: hypothetical protein K6C34_00955 [Alphaproteobacteria bacterium]|nr:hypothetical protein [Alphaproteobacteria bacterium]
MSDNYDPSRPWTKYATFDEDYKTLTKKLEPRTNYDAFMEIMDPDMLAFLFSENKRTNSCACCSEMTDYRAGNISCDLNCLKHIKDFLNRPYSESDVNCAKRHMYIPKEEVEDAR